MPGTGLAKLFKTLAGERGIEIDPDELEHLGLSDEEDGGTELPDITGAADDETLSQELPGRAAGMVELFLAADSTAVAEPVEKDNLMWYPIIREGQWAVRPGATGKKRRLPLKVVAGKSKNQRRQIGLQDLLDAFNDDAIQHVTVPSSHNNTVLENQGFIKGMKIVKGRVKNKLTKKDAEVDVLMGGYDITEPETKAKMSRGTIANRSAGILYDYINTETGKTYPAVVEHVALTNKPWITGMVSFGRKLTDGGIQTVALSLSDEGPDESEYTLALADEADLDDDADFLAQESADWSKEGSPSWLRQQVNTLLRDARTKKLDAKRKSANNGTVLYDDFPPNYRCVEAKPGQALIGDDWGDDANFWTAPITVKDGAVQLAEFSEWKALKKAFIPDERPAPSKDKLPLAQREPQGDSAKPKTRLELAQEARRERAAVPGAAHDDHTREVVEQQMAGTNGTSQLSDLSPEAQAAVQAAEERARQAEARAQRSEERIARLSETVQGGEVDKYVTWLSSDEDGLGLSEERGFGGFLAEVRQLMLADDGEPALQGDHFAQDGNTSGEITFSDGLRRVFGALAKSTEGKKKLGEMLSEPADPAADGEAGSGKEGEERGTNAGEGGTPAQTATTVPAGKPAAGEGEGEQLSTDQRAEKILADSPMLAGLVGAGAGAGSKNGGES